MIDGFGPEDRSGLTPVDGGRAPRPRRPAAGVVSGGPPPGQPAPALVVADDPATAAVVTTRNLVKAPSCTVSEQHAADGSAQAIVINAGNANVATPDGDAHALALASSAAQELGIDTDAVLVMSTGVIGVPLPIDRIQAAMPAAVAALSPAGAADAATAMLTTDTHPKQVAFRLSDGQGSATIAGMAKGVGMIEPNMATLLVVLATDAPLGTGLVRQLLRRAVKVTFNRISVDGDGSTSDTAALLATGSAPTPPGLDTLTRGLHAVCADLALQVVADGEGASRVAGVTVRGAATESDAEALARSVATSLLVRAAIHGADPNWGRILMALGNAGVEFDPRRVSVRCAGITVCRFGVAASFDRGQAAAAMQRDEVTIEVDVGSGGAQATVLTCDLTPEYVRFNAEYTT
ncbi:MAG: bifunctional glutamate N-acetyltransferase/amino-acid acetyltransferase ArgJ [Nitriliruptoraceae bacterium]|nr:bifunctional glutamate N-acetyltransferase/amino-acid acetyltransferase ArgJ [Nitriliruptoraceae bacterium]